MIKTINLTKSFDEVTAIKNLSLEINDGIVGIVGHNGAGKSTLLRLLANVIEPTSGEIFIDDNPCSDIKAKQNLFFLSDDPFVPDHADMKKLLEFYSCFYDIDVNTFNSIVESFKLPKTRKISEFSKGMKRQTFIALSLAIRCDYLLMDEAFDGLDPLAVEKIKSFIQESFENRKCILISSHNIHMLDKLVDTYVIISFGELTKEGSSDNLTIEVIKYQGLPANGKVVDENELKAKGLEVVSISKVGSIFQIVLASDDDVEAKLRSVCEWSLLEKVALSPEELIASQMRMEKGGK